MYCILIISEGVLETCVILKCNGLGHSHQNFVIVSDGKLAPVIVFTQQLLASVANRDLSHSVAHLCFPP